MLVEMFSPVFMDQGEIRPPIRFKKGLNVVLGKEDGANSIGKSSAMLAIDFVFGGDTYLKSDGVKHIGHHTIFFAFQFCGQKHYFARATEDADKVFLCKENYDLMGPYWTKDEFVNWLKVQYHMDFDGLSFRIALSSFFRIYGKDNTDERRPLRGIPGQDMEKSIALLVALFDRNKDIQVYRQNLAEEKKKLDVFKEARKYHFVSSLVGGKDKYEENLALIRDLEIQLSTLTEQADQGHTEEEIEKGKEKAQLDAQRLMLETELQSKQRKLKLVTMSLEYGLYPTEADLSALQEFFPGVNLRKLYEVERYHQKLAQILDEQFSTEQQSIEGEIDSLKQQLAEVRTHISTLGFIGNISKEFLDKHAEIKGKIDALKVQNEAFLTLKGLQDAKARADEILKKAIVSILLEIETELNDKMREFDGQLHSEPRKPPYLRFDSYNRYKFETPDDTGTGANFRSMIIYDLAVLFTTALPAIAHDSLILKNISDGAIDGIMKIYEKSEKQIFIAFDKQAAYTVDTQAILERNCVLRLSDGNCELYKRSKTNMKMSYNRLWKLLIDKNMKKSDLRKVAGVSSSSLAKLGKGENVTTDVILKICVALGCRVEDIMEIINDETITSES